MSNIKENMAITIYNYNPFVLSVNTNLTSHILQPCYDYDFPTSATVSFSELMHLNANSTAIRSGLVMFNKEQKAEIYEALGIRDWKNILTNEIIENIILEPNKDKLQKIVNITDASIFDRVIAVYQGLVSSGEYDVSNRVSDIIDIRKKEFRRGRNISEIKLRERDNDIKTSNDDIESLKIQNAKLQEQLKEMQSMMSDILKQSKTTKSTDNLTADKTPVQSKGRKPKNTDK